MIIKPNNNRRQNNAKPNRLNREIRAKEVRVTDADGKQLGIMSVREALEIAEERDLDLVEISPTANPPVCKIMDYGKFLYEKQKALKEQKKKQKVVQVKEIKFRPGTDEGDYQVKLRNLIRFFEDGDKAKISIRFRGREIVHVDLGVRLMERLVEDLKDYAVVESSSGKKVDGRQLVMTMAPIKKKS
ncbi:translation initiation factor IF-3 [Psittacicella melopsittaci]|uniref:translation initiation factor IF-3 n=1 Tax=Psittacicella melopsittaci TaxID=2028576 RepID=UPI003CFFB9AA